MSVSVTYDLGAHSHATTATKGTYVFPIFPVAHTHVEEGTFMSALEMFQS